MQLRTVKPAHDSLSPSNAFKNQIFRKNISCITVCKASFNNITSNGSQK